MQAKNRESLSLQVDGEGVGIRGHRGEGVDLMEGVSVKAACIGKF